MGLALTVLIFDVHCINYATFFSEMFSIMFGSYYRTAHNNYSGTYVYTLIMSFMMETILIYNMVYGCRTELTLLKMSKVALYHRNWALD
jgi:hypothetical protein